MTVDECNDLWRKMQEDFKLYPVSGFLRMQHENRFRAAFNAGDFDELQRLVDATPEVERIENRRSAGCGALNTAQLAVAAAEKEGRKLSVDPDTGAVVVTGGAIPQEHVVLALEYHARTVAAFLRDRDAPRIVVPARLCR